MSKKYQVAVDGFSSCGKSTLAKQIAQLLGAVYIDSGAMYRAIALIALRNNCVEKDSVNKDCLKPLVENVKIEFQPSDNHLILNGEDVELEIRGKEVASHVSEVAKHGFVREKMVKMQQDYSLTNSVVMDGSDIGTHVFPNAEVKLFLTADPEVRAQRRFYELKEKGMEQPFEEVLENIKQRDEADQNREIAPLRKADDATIIDNSVMSREQQLEHALQIIYVKLGEAL
ncbi:MAG: (d)CMP kinase [Salinivirgaceae bacterium]|nr:MAG: (d)CMP kinase [Salinivirgaceae bacterium]